MNYIQTLSDETHAMLIRYGPLIEAESRSLIQAQLNNS